MHTVQSTMTNWRLVNRLRTGIVGREGNKDRMTCGRVSPMMMPNAHMPRFLDKIVKTELSSWFGKWWEFDQPPNANANWKNETAARPLEPKQWFMISMYEWLPLSFAFITMRRMVQSVTAHRTMRRTRPEKKPDWRTAYGRPGVYQNYRSCDLQEKTSPIIPAARSEGYL